MLGKFSISILVLASFAAAADVKFGGIVINAGYSHFSGPYYPYYYRYPFYDWAWYNPFFHPGFYNGFSHGPDKGEIKLRTNQDKAEVYLDGAYAGLASDLKTIWLAPGAYNLEVKAPQRTPYTRRIYILTGKILKIDAPLEEVQP
jgi:PEGA domain-containing protein